MSWLAEQPIAHRGLHAAGVPENSLAAFEAAIAAGYPIELDVRRARDGIPIVFHDATLERMTSHTGTVSEIPATRLTEYNLAETNQQIPTFAAVLDLVDGQVPLLVEIKNRKMDHALETAVAAELSDYSGRFAVQSFNPVSLAYFRTQWPDWPRGQLAGTRQRGLSIRRVQNVFLKRLLLNWLSRPQFIAYEHTRLPYWPVTVHQRLGLPVLAWTISTRQALQEARKHADNVIFEAIRP